MARNPDKLGRVTAEAGLGGRGAGGLTLAVMPRWRQYLIAFAALVVIAPLIALAAKRLGRAARGGLMLASVLLGFGAVMDPPSRRLVEANEKMKKGSPETGEPPPPDASEDASTQA
jgi:hypothetical protein